MKKERQKADDDVQKDLQRYKDLLGMREKEVESLKAEYRRVLKLNEDLKRQIEVLDRDHELSKSVLYQKEPMRGVTTTKTIHEKSTSQAILEELSYNHAFES